MKYRRRNAEVEATHYEKGSEDRARISRWAVNLAGGPVVTPMIGPGNYLVFAEGRFEVWAEEEFEAAFEPVQDLIQLSDENRSLIYRAYDAGDGSTIVLRAGEDGYFTGIGDGAVVYEGIEIDGTLYSIVHLSGGGLTSVIIGRGLVENDAGATFHSSAEAKAYIKGLTAK